MSLHFAHFGFDAVCFLQKRCGNDVARAAASKCFSALKQQDLVGIMRGKIYVVHDAKGGYSVFTAKAAYQTQNLNLVLHI